MNKQLVILLMGRAQSGKDTLADIIKEEIEYGPMGLKESVAILAFADTLKNMCARNHEYINKESDRDVLIAIGDEMRNIDLNAFSKPVGHFIDIYQQLGYRVNIITDLRFINEFDYICEKSNVIPFVIKVQGIYEHKNVSIFAKNHPTENLDFTPDYTFVLPFLDKETEPKVREEVRSVLESIFDRFYYEIGES